MYRSCWVTLPPTIVCPPAFFFLAYIERRDKILARKKRQGANYTGSRLKRLLRFVQNQQTRNFLLNRNRKSSFNLPAARRKNQKLLWMWEDTQLSRWSQDAKRSNLNLDCNLSKGKIRTPVFSAKNYVIFQKARKTPLAPGNLAWTI